MLARWVNVQQADPMKVRLTVACFVFFRYEIGSSFLLNALLYVGVAAFFALSR